jgi:sugar diacid utilization regulator
VVDYEAGLNRVIPNLAQVPGPPLQRSVARDQLSSFHALLVLSMVMTRSGDEEEILRLATTAVPSLAPVRPIALWLDAGWRAIGELATPEHPGAISVQLPALPEGGGEVALGQGWGWSYQLTTLGGALGYLIVAAPTAPGAHQQFLLGALAQHTGVALANVRSHARERAVTEELRLANQALRRSTQIHERLTAVAAAGEGQAGIARAVHELTDRAVAIEDRHGNLITWAGPATPDPYPKAAPAAREALLRRVGEAGHPLRADGRLVALAEPGEEILGVIALVDPGGTARESDLVALEHGATVLAMELAHVRTRAETALRLRRDLVEELLAGIDAEHSRTRARILDYDLDRPHRVLVVECSTLGHRPSPQPPDTDGSHFHAVRRAARACGAGSLLASRGPAVIVLADGETDWERLRDAVLRELRPHSACRIGVGGTCHAPEDFPRSLHQAQMALRMQRLARAPGQATTFDGLGVYRMLAELPEEGTVESYVREWLGRLLDYDERKGSTLVETLSVYLECGGNYDATGKALSLHRSTLRYRLQRLRELSGHDFSDPDVRFNLQLATRAWSTVRALQRD